MDMVPRTSIILPTFNRADVLGRAIQSVQAQSDRNWELLVIDDGSTDGTARLVREFADSRIRYIWQANRGCYAARNKGLESASGKYIAFLDSDDAWSPHFLQLTTSYLDNTDAPWVMTEFWVDNGRGEFDINDRHSIGGRLTKMARLVSSPMLDLPEGSNDDYLRVFEWRHHLRDTLPLNELQPEWRDAFVYSGNIFEYYRWNYLGWLPTTVLRRHILGEIGMFDESYRSAADYLFLASLSRKHCASMIAIPCATKHESGINDVDIVESHLAKGRHEYKFATRRIELFLELFGDRDDDELRRIWGLHECYAGRVALYDGNRLASRRHLRRAARLGLSRFHYTVPSIVAHLSPTNASARLAYRALRKAGDRLGVRL